MALRPKVVRKKAEKVEFKCFQNYKINLCEVSGLEDLLQDVYRTRWPKPSDYEVRKDLVRVFNEIAKEIYGNSKDVPVVKEFGSFLMDLFSVSSDLDLSVNFSSKGVEITREKKIQTLRKFAKKLYALQRQGHVHGVHPITTAKVPIVKVIDSGTGVECDLSVENRDGILKSELVHLISSIDERFRKLCFLMKNWAKAQCINSSRDRTLNSLSIILLVAFHLQTRSPPILPPFSAFLRDGNDPAKIVKLLPNFKNYGNSNKESLAELFVTLLIKLSSVEKLWQKGLCVSTYEGSWTSRTWNSKVGCINVEDFTDRSQNVARAVGTEEVKLIHKRVRLSIRNVVSFMNGQFEQSSFREFLFGREDSPKVGGGIEHFVTRTVQHAKPPGSVKAIEGQYAGQQKRSRHSMQRMPLPKHQGEVLLQNPERIRKDIAFDPFLVKRMRVTDALGAIPTAVHGRNMTAGAVGTQHWGNLHGVGWGGTQQPIAGGGWAKRQQQVGGRVETPIPIAVGWGGQQLHNEGWNTTHAGGWIGGRQQLITDGWGGRQQHVVPTGMQAQVWNRNFLHIQERR